MEDVNLENYLRLDELEKRSAQIKKIFFYRVCGTGMGAAATLLRERGYDVHGGDEVFARPMSDYLKTSNIPLIPLSDVDDKYLKNFDLIVVGNVVPRKSLAAQQIENCGVPFTSFPSALGALVLIDMQVVGIAGTHGKTTTTFFLTQLLENLGEKPGHFVGAVLDGRSPAKLGNSKYFVIESDEYDSSYFEKYAKFHSYKINDLILTSLEFDHADIYADIGEIEEQFKKLISGINSTIVINSDYNSNRKLVNNYPQKEFYRYGINSIAGPLSIAWANDSTTFFLEIKKERVEFKTNVFGLHNVLNLSASIIWALSRGFKLEEIKVAIRQMQMPKRRQENRGKYKNAIVIDDFAHHPTALKLTLDSIKEKFSDYKINCVVDLNSATARSSIFQHEFAEVLLACDGLIVVQPTRDTTVKSSQNLDCNKLAQFVGPTAQIPAIVVKTQEELISTLQEWCVCESVLVVFSNGSCLNLWDSEFVNEIKK